MQSGTELDTSPYVYCIHEVTETSYPFFALQGRNRTRSNNAAWPSRSTLQHAGQSAFWQGKRLKWGTLSVGATALTLVDNEGVQHSILTVSLNVTENLRLPCWFAFGIISLCLCRGPMEYKIPIQMETKLPQVWRKTPLQV